MRGGGSPLGRLRSGGLLSVDEIRSLSPAELPLRTERACDLVVGLVAGISGYCFSFPIEGLKNDSFAERLEVRRFLESLPAAR